MKRIISLVVLSLFVLSGLMFAKNAAELKVAIQYVNAKNYNYVVLGDSSYKIRVFITLLDEDGNPATAGPSGEVISTLTPSFKSATFGTGLTAANGFSSTTWNGASTRYTLDYGSVTLTKASPTISEDTLTVQVGTLKASGKINVKPPKANGIVMLLPGSLSPITPSVLGYDFSGKNDSASYDNDSGITKREVGAEVPFYVYLVNGNAFTTDSSWDGKTVTVKSSKDETAECTISNGMCNGKIKITKVGSDSSPVTLTATLKYDNGAVLGTDSSKTSNFEIRATGISVKNLTLSGSLSNFLYDNNSGDNQSIGRVCAVDSYGNIDNDSSITAINISPDNISDNISIQNGALNSYCVEISDNKTGDLSNIGAGSQSITITATVSTLTDNVTTAFTNSYDIEKAHLPVYSFLAGKSTYNAGDKVALVVVDGDNNSIEPIKPYLSSNNIIVELNNGSTNIDNVTPTILTGETDASGNKYWLLSFEIDNASIDNISVYDKTLSTFYDNGSSGTGLAITVSPNYTKPKIVVDNATQISDDTISVAMVADGKTGNALFLSTNVKITDTYGNLFTGASPNSITSAIGTLYPESGVYKVIYQPDDVGKTDNITITYGDVTKVIQVTNIVAAASKFKIEAVAPTNWNEFASYYTQSEVLIKVSTDGYLTSSKSYKLYSSDSNLKIYPVNSFTALSLPYSDTLSAGASSANYYLVYASAAGTYTVTVHDDSIVSPWDNATLTLTFAQQDKEAPSITAPTVIAGGISFQVTDNVGVDSVTVKVTDADGNEVSDVTVTEGDNNTWTVTGLEPGTYTFDITAADAEGNSVSKSYIREVTEAAPTCDANHLDLCTTETDCTGAGGVWDNGTCSAPAPSNEVAPELEAGQPTAPTKTVSVTASDNVTIKPTLTIAEGDSPEAYYVVLTDGTNWYVWTGGLNFAPIYSLEDLQPVASGYYTVSENKVTFDLYQGSLEGASGASFDVWCAYRVGKDLKYNAFTLEIK